MKEKVKRMRLINAFVLAYENAIAFSGEEQNDEYKMNIGTIYKGSIEESNRMFRIRQRFKTNNDGVFWHSNRLCEEVI